MANVKEFTFVELDNMLSKIDDRGSISTTNAFSQIDEFIDTGNYLLNAQISGSLFGGYPNCRTIALAGETGCLQKDETVLIYILKSKQNETKQKETRKVIRENDL